MEKKNNNNKQKPQKKNNAKIKIILRENSVDQYFLAM